MKCLQCLSFLILIIVAFSSCDNRMQGMMKPVVEEMTEEPFADVPRIMASDAFIQDKITGPWLWMIAPTEMWQGGAASIDIDSLAVASDGAVTEMAVATNGVSEGDRVGDLTWTLGTINSTDTYSSFGNVNYVVNEIGLGEGDLDDYSSYALISVVSATDQSDVTMRVGSDDAIKVWLNGEVVHNNPVDRAASDFQDEFKVDLKMGDNLLLVKVSERDSGWVMFVGIKEPSESTEEPAEMPVEMPPDIDPEYADLPLIRNLELEPGLYRMEVIYGLGTDGRITLISSYELEKYRHIRVYLHPWIPDPYDTSLFYTEVAVRIYLKKNVGEDEKYHDYYGSVIEILKHPEGVEIDYKYQPTGYENLPILREVFAAGNVQPSHQYQVFAHDWKTSANKINSAIVNLSEDVRVRVLFNPRPWALDADNMDILGPSPSLYLNVGVIEITENLGVKTEMEIRKEITYHEFSGILIKNLTFPDKPIEYEENATE